ncbi:STM3941 family protein [Chitinophagaceae bacterium LWZ2-11]
MQTFPYSIYVNKKAARGKMIFCILFAIGCIWGFWYGSGKFFTENYYYPKMVLMMPICLVIMIVLSIKEYKNFKNDDALLTITQTGIQFFAKQYTDIGIVPWRDITGCTEIKNYNDKALAVTVKDVNIYTNKIQDNSARQKILKFSKKNGNDILFNINPTMMDCDIVEFKKTIYQMIEKTTV